MQRLLTSGFFSLILCLCLSTSVIAQKGWGKGISGTGPIIEKELNLEPFQGFDFAVSGDVVVRQGSRQEVRVEGQENIIDNLKTEVRDGIWKISFKSNTRNYKKFVVYITLPELTMAELSGSGNIKSKGKFSSSSFKAHLTGSGNMELAIDTDDLNVKLSGSGNIFLDGSAKQTEMKLSGSGNIKTFDLASEHCEARISGSGNIKLHAVQSLMAHVSGSGTIYYKGEPNKLRSKVSGSGNVVSRS